MNKEATGEFKVFEMHNLYYVYFFPCSFPSGYLVERTNDKEAVMKLCGSVAFEKRKVRGE